jgi:cell division cycle 2-like protein
VVERGDRREERLQGGRDGETGARADRLIRANRHMEDSRRDVDARKKRKLIEKEMEKLQAKIGRRVDAGRSRSGSRDGRRRKEEAGESEEEEGSDEGEEGSGALESEEEEGSESDDGAVTDATTGSQKSEDTPNRDEDSDGEVEDAYGDMEVEDEGSKEASKSPEVTTTGSKSRWAERSPSRSRTPSRSPTPLRDLDTPLKIDDTPPHSGAPSPLAPRDPPSPAARPTPAPPRAPEPVINRFSSLPPYLPSVHGCRSVAEFQCMNRIEEGTYGVVYRAKDKRTEEIVALKRLKMEREKEGFPITSLREINTLLIAQHVNVVTVREIVVGSNMDQIFIVMDFVEHDLKGLMETMRKKNQVFLPGEVKCLMQQLLRAIHHLHDNWILHRDLKASNLLLSHNGILKVGDFGLAREYGSPLKNYTAIVVTLWYRAPELLLGTKQYSTHIDVWSVGCILGELLLMEPLFPGKSEVDELNKIFKLLGTPSERIWPGYKELPGVKSMKFVDFPVSQLRHKFPERMLSDGGLDLLKSLLTYDPKQRTTCEKALGHRWFDENPRPIDPSMFPTWPAKSEQDPGAKKVASPPPPSGGGAFKNIDDDEARVNRSKGFNLIEAVKNNPPTAGWNLKF